MLIFVISGAKVRRFSQKRIEQNCPTIGQNYLLLFFSKTMKTSRKQLSGMAKHMRASLPNATFIGFTGTPIDFKEKSTIAVFGDYIDIYDMTQAVDDGATVPIYYENRTAKLKLNEATLHSR